MEEKEKEKEEWLKTHDKIALSVAHSLWRLGYRDPMFDFEDVLQLARLGVWKAICNFEEGHGALLSSYAYGCSKNEVFHFFEAFTRKKRSHESLLYFSDLLSTLDGEIKEKDLELASEDDLSFLPVSEFINSLPQSEQRILGLLMTGLNDREVGERMGISRRVVCQRRNKILRSYQKHLQEGLEWSLPRRSSGSWEKPRLTKKKE